MSYPSPEELFSRKIVKLLWPSIQLENRGSKKDCAGIDGLLQLETMQLKYDEKINITRNFYDQHFHRYHWHEGSSGEWIEDPRIADYLISITGGNIKSGDLRGAFAVKVKYADLDEIEATRRIEEINPTSQGFLIPLNILKPIMELKRISDITTIFDFADSERKPEFSCLACATNNWYWPGDYYWGPKQWICGVCHPTTPTQNKTTTH